MTSHLAEWHLTIGTRDLKQKKNYKSRHGEKIYGQTDNTNVSSFFIVRHLTLSTSKSFLGHQQNIHGFIC